MKNCLSSKNPLWKKTYPERTFLSSSGLSRPWLMSRSLDGWFWGSLYETESRRCAVVSRGQNFWVSIHLLCSCPARLKPVTCLPYEQRQLYEPAKMKTSLAFHKGRGKRVGFKQHPDGCHTGVLLDFSQECLEEDETPTEGMGCQMARRKI